VQEFYVLVSMIKQLIYNRDNMKKNILLITALPIILSSILTAQAAEQSTTNVSITNSGVSAAPTASTPEVVKEVTISDAWARKSISPNNNSAAYMKISNPTDKDIVIIGASASETANNVELHKSFVDEKGVSRMTSIDKIVVPAKTDIELAPGAIHVMLFDLKKSLNTGDKFNIEIKIEGKTPIVVQTEVK
jgi:copper(I)-binding protein